MIPARQRAQRFPARAEHLDRKCEIERRTDRGDAETPLKIALAQPRVHQRGFPARVRAEEQTNIRPLDAGNRRVEQVAGAATRIELGAVLPTIEARRSNPGEELLQREHRLGVAQIAGNGRDSFAGNLLKPIRDKIKGLPPINLAQLAVAANVGAIEPPPDQPVDRETGLVRDPFFVHRLVEARQYAHYLRSAGIDPDVAADSVEDIDRFGLPKLPRPGDEGIGLRGQGADRAPIDNVGRELGAECSFDISADLHILAAPGSAELLDPGDFGQEANAARAVDAAVHAGLDQRTKILVVDGPLVLLEPAAVEPVSHRLVLQIAFTALIADRTVERMVDQQEFHDALLRLDRLLRG